MQRDLSLKEAELKHLTVQLEHLTNQNSDHVTELQEQIDVLTVCAPLHWVQTNTYNNIPSHSFLEKSALSRDRHVHARLQEKVAALSVQKKEMEAEDDEDAPVEEMLSSALLQEKNLEIDHLSNEIQKLEQELESTKNNEVRKCTNRFIALP